ncbi:MAG: spore protease YyaC [Syntrophomonas sp.]|nr:spore protease YyaC [Syntrophomonas sp.]
MDISIVKKAGEKFSYHYEDPACLNHLENGIYNLLTDMNSGFKRDIVYLCIGTDRATGDCLGPLVGTRLQAMSPAINLFGTLEKPSHAANLESVLEEIANQYKNPLVVAVDASLGNTDRIGYINIKPGGLKPGTALKKMLPEVGDFHISAVVNVGGFLEQMVLQNTRLYVVYKMADLIARSLYLSHLHYDNDRSRYRAPTNSWKQASSSIAT